MNANTITSYGVECLLRLKGVQVTQIQCRKSAFIRGLNSPVNLAGEYKLIVIGYLRQPLSMLCGYPFIILPGNQPIKTAVIKHLIYHD
jgi:hypothetical protein